MQLVAVDFLPPEVLQQQMQRVSGLLAGGHITPLRMADYSMTSVVAAMRLLAQASHVGKVSLQRCACGRNQLNTRSVVTLQALCQNTELPAAGMF